MLFACNRSGMHQNMRAGSGVNGQTTRKARSGSFPTAFGVTGLQEGIGRVPICSSSLQAGASVTNSLGWRGSSWCLWVAALMAALMVVARWPSTSGQSNSSSSSLCLMQQLASERSDSGSRPRALLHPRWSTTCSPSSRIFSGLTSPCMYCHII